jgi:uncharacterized protein YecE (DUF72 family)
LIRVGISGWRYPTWRGVFYPDGLAQRRELEFASRQMNSIEINGSFYSLQRPSSYVAWRDEVPEGFVFAVKGSRFITHNKKLRVDDLTPLANFFASGVLALEEKLGPVLWQLPPQLSFDAGRIKAFLSALPRTTREAAKLARKHDVRIKHGDYVEVRVDRPIRYAFEVRHASFDDRTFFRLLRDANAALCIADTAGKWWPDPWAEHEPTADFLYARLHGSKRLYASGYSSAELDRWAERITRFGGDAYVYFDNDVKVRAPFDAINLAARFDAAPRVRYPRKRHKLAEARRGAEEVRTTWDRWSHRRRSA